MTKLNASHGSPHDRGGADSYYGRSYSPHYWPNGTGHGIKVVDLTEEQLKEYNDGWDENEDFGHFKDWGQPTGLPLALSFVSVETCLEQEPLKILRQQDHIYPQSPQLHLSQLEPVAEKLLAY